MRTLKQHPIAWAFFAAYLSGWGWIGYQAFFDFYNYGDGQAIGINLFLFIIFGFIPYLVITFILAELFESTRAFYMMLVRSILASLPAVAIIGGILDVLIPTH